jgi:hypothetical protein
MIFGYNQQELKNVSSIDELWELLDSQVIQFFKQYEMHRQFDRRLVGDSKDKDKSKDTGKSEPYSYQKTADSKPTNSYNNKNYTSHYQKTSSTNQIPAKKKFSNISKVFVKNEEEATNEAESIGNENDELDENFGQIAPPKSDARNISSSSYCCFFY